MLRPDPEHERSQSDDRARMRPGPLRSDTATKMPSLFVSHGAPTLAVESGSAHQFLRHLGQSLSVPRAIIAFSAHYDTPRPTITASARPTTIHDFHGFPAALHAMRYDAPGAPDLAADIADQLASAGFDPILDHRRGLDHGAWVPLSLMYPAADIPVIQVSIDGSGTAQRHWAMGAALSRLRAEGVLILGSGSLTHNLSELDRGTDGKLSPPPSWVIAFSDWVNATLRAGDVNALMAWETVAPFGRRNHPTAEHFLPLFVAMGAAYGPLDALRPNAGAATRLHQSTEYGALAMDCYRFDAV